jgi:tetratricopeptide (TPR) repeat protein
MSFARWSGLVGLLLTCCALAPHVAIAQELVSSGHSYNQQTSAQQPSASDASAALPALTPELDADLLVAHQRYQDAINAYRKITPQTAEIYNKIGICYQRLSMNDEAISNYDRAMKMDRKLAAVYNNLGTIEYHQKDNKHAERLYRKAIKIEPKTAAFWSNLGAAYLADTRYRDGAEAYQRAFILDTDIFQEIALNGVREFASQDDLAKMDLCFAGIYAQAGMKDMAVEYLRKALLEGFHDKQSLQQNQQFAGLRGDPAFEQLLGDEHKR